jgi:hypothetical protein
MWSLVLSEIATGSGVFSLQQMDYGIYLPLVRHSR